MMSQLWWPVWQPVEFSHEDIQGRQQIAEGDVGGDRGVAVFREFQRRRSDEQLLRQDVGHDRQRIDAGIEDAEKAAGQPRSSPGSGCQWRTSSFQMTFTAVDP